MPTSKHQLCKHRGQEWYKEGLESFDLLGQNVNLTFERKPIFNTSYGGVISIICSTFLVLFIATRSIKLFGGYDPMLSMLPTTHKSEKFIDLGAMKYFFAVEQIDPKYGRL